MTNATNNNKTQDSVISIGCRLNAYEASVIKSIIKSLELDEKIVVVNTCTITNESERQCRQEIRKTKRNNLNKYIVVTGCASQLHADLFRQMPEVDFVIGNAMKLQKSAYNNIKDYILGLKEKAVVQEFLLSDIDTEEPDTDGYDEMYKANDRERALIGIQTGCNHYCSFCIVPFVRGKMKSLPESVILEQVWQFIDNGYNEVVLTGVDITDYGTDLSKDRSHTLAKLCRAILDKTSIKRLRLSSVDVAEIDVEMMEIICNEKRLMPFFHISLQSGDNYILKKMRRRHTREDVLNFCKIVKEKRPDAAFGADIIAGFPGETEDQFMNSVYLAQDACIHFMHAFPYSRKEKTLAYNMNDDVLKDEKKRRVALLNQVGAINLDKLSNEMLNTVQSVIVEANFIGRAENFHQIVLNVDNKVKIGSVINVRVNNLINGKLYGEEV